MEPAKEFPCPVNLNLCGLTDSPNYRFLRLWRQRVRLKLDCGGKPRPVAGVLTGVGHDFVTLRRNDHAVITVVSDRIRQAKRLSG
ncbi:MAG: hypothetical protein IMX00_09500 [Limnochordales bacterium]|nr:hypothetical protein [Limnochordales bacterium]